MLTLENLSFGVQGEKGEKEIKQKAVNSDEHYVSCPYCYCSSCI